MTYTQLRRLLSINTSPIYSHFAESVMGASSIRAYKKQQPFAADSDILFDAMQEAGFASIHTDRLGSLELSFYSPFLLLGLQSS